MAGNDTQVSRITRAFGSVTSIFRCHGLQYIPPNADSIGGHDLFYWCGFLALLSAWFLLLYSPQSRRAEKLIGRQQALSHQLSSDKKELARLEVAINNLKSGDALAWERAARARMGWLEPGEVLDARALRSQATEFAQNSNVNTNRSSQPGTPLPNLARPRVPRIPNASTTPPAMVANGLAGRSHFADAGSLGPTTGRPPAPPPAPDIPRLPPRPLPRSTPVRPPAVQPVNYRTNGR